MRVVYLTNRGDSDMFTKAVIGEHLTKNEKNFTNGGVVVNWEL